MFPLHLNSLIGPIVAVSVKSITPSNDKSSLTQLELLRQRKSCEVVMTGRRPLDFLQLQIIALQLTFEKLP